MKTSKVSKTDHVIMIAYIRRISNKICQLSENTITFALILLSEEKTIEKRANKVVCSLELNDLVKRIHIEDEALLFDELKKIKNELHSVKVNEIAFLEDWFQSDNHITVKLNAKLVPFYDEIIQLVNSIRKENKL